MFLSNFSGYSQNYTTFKQTTYYRLTNQWQGENLSLDIVNDGINNQPILAKTAKVSGQYWKIKKVGKDTFTLSTEWQGPHKVLDCVQGENQNRPILNRATRKSGGAWKIIAVGNDYYRITNLWLGNLSLDIINDGENNKIQVAKTGEYSGQFWKITAINSGRNSINTQASSTPIHSGPKRNTNNFILQAGEYLPKGSSIRSPNNQYQLKFQTDGNLAYYGPNNKYIWDAKTNGKGHICALEKNGNLVVYDNFLKPIWSSKTMATFDRKYTSYNWKPVKLEISNTGICALKSTTNITSWTCGTKAKPEITRINSYNTNTTTTSKNKFILNSGESLLKGASIWSKNNLYELKFESTGNLVFYDQNKQLVWDTKTAGKGETCSLQTNGNFAILDKLNNIVWSTETSEKFDWKYDLKDWKPIKLEIDNYGLCSLKSAKKITSWKSKIYPNSRYTNPDITNKTEITIGNQIWKIKNLDVTTYNDGTPIPEVKNIKEWATLKTGAWCYYNNDPKLGKTYGKLYNWYAVKGIYNEASQSNASLRKKLAPNGWRVPSKNDWQKLELQLEGVASAGGKLKEANYSHWNGPNVIGSNKSGFTALPAGERLSDSEIYDRFNGLRNFTSFWSTSEDSDQWKTGFSLSTNTCDSSYNQIKKNAGISIRCNKN